MTENAAQQFALANLSWHRRVLVVSAADANAAKVQLDAIGATREAFQERDMILVALLDSGRSYAGDRVLTPREVAHARNELGLPPGRFRLRLIGKDGSVKLAADEFVAPSSIYALIDTMPMRRQEMSK